MGAVVASGLACEHQRRQKDLGYTEANDQHIKASSFTISPNPACDTFCGEHYPSGRRLNRSATDDHTVASDYVIAQRRPAMLVCTKLPSCVCSRPARPQQAVAYALHQPWVCPQIPRRRSCRRSPTEPGPWGDQRRRSWRRCWAWAAVGHQRSVFDRPDLMRDLTARKTTPPARSQGPATIIGSIV